MITTLRAGPDREVPVGFGWHPYLVAGSDPVDTWCIELPFEEQVVLQDRLPIGASIEVAPAFDVVRERDDCFVARSGQTCDVRSPTTTTSISFDQGFGWAMVWSPEGAPFICIEPIAGPLLSLRDGSAAPVIPAGGRFSAGFTLS